MSKKTAPYKPVLRITFGDRTFDIVKLMASEVSKINLWTGFASKKEWIDALAEDNIEAYKAAYTLMCQRAGEEARIDTVDFDTDDLAVDWVDPATGLAVSPMFVKDKKGDLVLGKDGQPTAVMEDGQPVWLFDDTDERVPLRPTEPAQTT
jgi:hypothetical protein